MALPSTNFQQTNVVCKFTCPLPHSQAVEYVGLTQTKLSRRLTYHGQNGSILNHFQESHNCKPTREQLTANTVIVTRESDRYKLCIKEALVILNTKPLINKQFDNFSNILKLYNLGNSNSRPCNIEKATISSPLTQITSSSPTQDIPTTQNLLTSEYRPRHDSNSNTNDVCMPDMDTVLLRFGIDTSKFRTQSLKYYENEMLLTEVLVEDESPTISQRIRSLRREARYTKKYCDTHFEGYN